MKDPDIIRWLGPLAVIIFLAVVSFGALLMVAGERSEARVLPGVITEYFVGTAPHRTLIIEFETEGLNGPKRCVLAVMDDLALDCTP